MESACTLEKGPLLTFGSVIQRPHKSSWASYHLPCINSYLPSVLSTKWGNLSSVSSGSQKHFASHTDASVELATTTLTLSACCLKGDGGRGRALATLSTIRLHSGRKLSPIGCGVKPFTKVCSLSSSSFVYLSLDVKCSGTVSRQAANQRSRQAISAMVLRLPGQLEARAEQRFGETPARWHLFELDKLLPLRGRGKRNRRGGYGHVCEANDKDDKGKSVPDDENPDSAEPGNDGNVPGGTPEPEAPESDWRAFRARLVVSEQQSTDGSETQTSEGEAETQNDLAGALSKRWAHPIFAPEAGCVLIATDKIDGQQSFERSVILLLSPGSSNPREGPYGLILNRPLSCLIKDIKPKDRTLVKFFGNCQVHHGGPLDEDMFLLLHGTEGVKGYKEVIPGVYYGAASGLEEIMRGRRPLDYRFFFGYSGWSVDQLKKEVEQGLWCVAACSTDLITGHSAAGLWEEILLLMGGKYAELSKRPRRKHF